MASKIFEDFGLSPESNALDNFMATAKAIEQWVKTKTYYEIMRCNVQGTTLGTNNRAKGNAQGPYSAMNPMESQ